MKLVVKKIEELTPSREAEAIPMDASDQDLIKKSIESDGMIAPILISALPVNRQKQHAILDGVNRWKAARNLGHAEIACLLVETDQPELIPIKMLLRRKTTTAQRVMAYLEVYREQVFAARREATARSAQNLKKGQCFPITLKEGSGFSPAAIGERLGVPQEDVRSGIELLEALEAEKDDGRRERIETHRKALLEGQTADQSLRRWKSAVGGRGVKKGGRQAVDFHQLAYRTSASLVTIFENWAKISPLSDEQPYPRYPSERAKILGDFRRAFAATPPEVLEILSDSILTQWPEGARAALYRRLHSARKQK